MYQQDKASSRSPVCPGSSVWSRAQNYHPAIRLLLSAALSLQVAAPSVLSERCLARTALWEMPLGAVLFQVEMPGEVVQPFISAGLCPFSPRSSAACRMQTDILTRSVTRIHSRLSRLSFFPCFSFSQCSVQEFRSGESAAELTALGMGSQGGHGVHPLPVCHRCWWEPGVCTGR